MAPSTAVAEDSTAEDVEKEMQKIIAGIECTEDEPDDNFRLAATGPTHAPAARTAEEGIGAAAPADCAPAASGGTAVAGPDAAEPVAEAEEPKLLQEAWHQLQGVPRPSGSGSRFLAWGEHGHVASFQDQQRLEIVFAVGENQAQRITDRTGLNMAAMSNGACVLAAGGAGSQGGSQVVIRPRERWEKAVFSASLGKGDETVVAVACGSDFAAALTSHRLLRLYALSALPLGIVSVGGPGVALAARGPLLLVVTRVGECDGVDEDMLEYRFLDVHARTQRAAGRLPLSSGARLRWLGLSAELIPVTIDSKGIVRALLGTGAGSWGPSAGGGGEWTPVLSIAEDEARMGPLWAVHAAQGAIFFVESGQDLAEPVPDDPLPADAEATGEPPRFGHGAKLRELRWHVPLGPMAACGAAAEEAFREQLVARHVEEMKAAGLFSMEEAETAGAVGKGWMVKVLTLFGSFLKASEQERALDVARTFMTLDGSMKLLSCAQDFAEKAGCHKLADKIAELPGSGNRVPPAPTPQTTSQMQTSVPKVVHKVAPPLFEEGEFDRKAEKTVNEKDNAAAAPPTEAGNEASSIRTASSSTVVSPTPASMPSASPSPEAKSAPLVQASRSVSDLSDRSSADSLHTGAASGKVAAAVVPANPFARKRKPAEATVRAPHLLRDALGSGVRRPTATPMNSAAAGSVAEAPSKVARTS